MFTMTDEERVAVERLCRELGVKRLDLFGSATSDEFDPERSDLDFLYQFNDPFSSFDNFFELQEGLEEIFERRVDLVPDKRSENRFFREAVRRTRRPFYAA